MSEEYKVEDVITYFKAELKKLEGVEDEKVKEVLTGLNDYIAKIEPTEEPKEEPKEDEAKSEEETTESSDESEEKADEPKEEGEEATEEVKEDGNAQNEGNDDEGKSEEGQPKGDSEDTDGSSTTPVNEEVDAKEGELSAKVSAKLDEAAIELNRMEKDLQAKDEVIAGYQAKIAELEADLKVYKDAEAQELANKFDAKVDKLVELYANIGIKKDPVELKNTFNEEQIDKMTIDLSAIGIKKPVNAGKRETTVSPDLELSAHKPARKREMTELERAHLLYGI